MAIYRSFELITVCGEELRYVKPGLVQMPMTMQWLVQGLAPTFLTREQIDSMTAMETFNDCISYINGLKDSEMSEDEKNSLWGAALVTSQASIDYLFPAIKQCFPDVKLEDVTDEALNEILSIYFTDYFKLVSNA